MKKRLLIFLGLIALVICANASKVVPVRFDTSISPGGSKEFTLNINGTKGEYNQSLLIYASDLFMHRNGALSFTRRESGISAVEWIKIDTEKISLFEGQSKKVKFKISVPYNAKPGEYYAVIMVDPENFTKVKDKDKAVSLLMKTRVSVVIILDVPGRNYEKKGEVVETKVNVTDSVTQIISTFKNTGNIHLDISGEGIVRSDDGRINYGRFTLKAPGSSKEKAFIFPGAMRDFVGVFDRQLPKGEYLVDISFDYGYQFKKAEQSQKFVVKRGFSSNENKNEFLSLESKELNLQIPEGGRRTQVIRVTNIDYRPLNINILSDNWIEVIPNNLNLKPGEVRNVMAIVSVSKYENDQKESIITLKTDRGMGSQIKVLVSSNKKIDLN